MLSFPPCLSLPGGLFYRLISIQGKRTLDARLRRCSKNTISAQISLWTGDSESVTPHLGTPTRPPRFLRIYWPGVCSLESNFSQ